MNILHRGTVSAVALKCGCSRKRKKAKGLSIRNRAWSGRKQGARSQQKMERQVEIRSFPPEDKVSHVGMTL